MKVELTADELHMVIQTLNICQIKGEDAPALARLMNKIQKALDKSIASMPKPTTNQEPTKG